MKEIVFVCFTTYHLLVSMYYAYKLKNVKKTLIFKDFANYHIDDSFYKKFFDDVFIIPYYNSASKFFYQFHKSYYGGFLFKLSPLYKYLENIRNSIAIYFSDQEVSSNKIVRILMNNEGNVIILSEEGLGLYIDKHNNLTLKNKIGNVLCGLNTCGVIGESNLYDALFVKKPELIHNRLKNKKIIKQNELLLDNNFVNSVNFNININSNSLKKKLIILGEPIEELHIDRVEYIKSIDRIIKLYKDKYDVYIKPHPREDKSTYNSLNDCIVLNNLNWVPVELLVLKYGFNILISICSAAVINLAKINLGMNIYLTYKLYELELNSDLEKEFKKYNNISIISKYEDFSKITYINSNANAECNKNCDLEFIDNLINMFND